MNEFGWIAARKCRYSLAAIAVLTTAGVIELAGDGHLAAAPPAPRAEKKKAGATLTFERDARPILRAHCLDCHGSQGAHKGNLDLRLRRLMVSGGESGAAIEPGKPDESYLLDRVKAGEMPPGDQKLSAAEIAVLEAWIAAGAPTSRPEPADLKTALFVTDEDREFWCYRPIVRPSVPQVAAADRVCTPIDAFLFAAMRGKGLKFSPDADKRTLIRRVSLDLIGLPPEPDEIAAFLADTSPDSYERLVERLLDSPHYGERWGRHWLDVAGYADSEGYDDQDAVRPEAYRYRDYVIRAFNANKPFDQFVIEQMAGDELVPPPHQNLSPEAIDRLTATGFLRMAADGTATAGSNLPTASNQVVADTIKIVSTSLLGMTVGCAQCHDHRYDPIAQEDYYHMRAVFEPALNWKNWRVPTQRRVSLYSDADRQHRSSIEAEAGKLDTARNQKSARYIAEALEKELAKLDPAVAVPLKAAVNAPANKRTAAQKALLEKYPSANITEGTLYQYNPAAADDLKKDVAKVNEIRARIRAEEFVRVLSETPGEAPPTFLFFRGDFQQPKQQVPPGDLTVCVAPGDSGLIPADDPKLPTTGRRLAYARRLMSGKQPLVGRVLVNRIWLQHFGRGLVGTPSDFGHMGEKPTHPELLDWLADEFAANGWDLKRLHRLMVLSTAYRQSSVRDPKQDAIDPDNRLYSRMNLRRLDAEIIRDSMLAVSGGSWDEMFGRPVPVKEDAVGQIVVGVDSKVGANEPGADIPIGNQAYRRSLYIEVRRSRPLAMLRAFDAPVMETNCDRRIASTAAPQALMMMNSDFVLAQSHEFAKRLEHEAGDDPREQVELAFAIALGRPADPTEIEQSVFFLKSQSQLVKSTPKAKPAAAPPVVKGKKARRKYTTTVTPAPDTCPSNR